MKSSRSSAMLVSLLRSIVRPILLLDVDRPFVRSFSRMDRGMKQTNKHYCRKRASKQAARERASGRTSVPASDRGSQESGRGREARALAGWLRLAGWIAASERALLDRPHWMVAILFIHCHGCCAGGGRARGLLGWAGGQADWAWSWPGAMADVRRPLAD